MKWYEEAGSTRLLSFFQVNRTMTLRLVLVLAGLVLAGCPSEAPPASFSEPVSVTVEASQAGPGLQLVFATAGSAPEAAVGAVTSAVVTSTRRCPALAPAGTFEVQVEWKAGSPPVVLHPVGAAGECVRDVLAESMHAAAAKLNVRALVRPSALDAGAK